MMGEPIEQSAGEALRAEHAGPFFKRQIGGDDGGAAFVALAEYFEQQFGAGLRRSGQRSISVPSALQMDSPNLLHRGFEKIT